MNIFSTWELICVFNHISNYLFLGENFSTYGSSSSIMGQLFGHDKTSFDLSL